MGELGWYLLKDRNIDFINNFSSFWKNIADEGGHINSNYGSLLFGEQLQWALDSLKNDKNTRQAVCFLNQPKFQYEGNKDFVCTMYLNFWIRDNKLNMKVQMRSNDIFYGLSYDAPFFSFVQQSMWHWLRNKYEDLEMGTYYHSADNIHYYERHFELADKIVYEDDRPPIWFHLRDPLFFLNNGNMLPTVKGLKFMEKLSELTKQETISQEESKELLSQFFYIQ
jgi:thymidylate synthase